MKIEEIIKQALAEDIGGGDVTTAGLKIGNEKKKAVIIAKETGILAGVILVKHVFYAVDKTIKVSLLKDDSEKIKKNEKIIEISGKLESILKGERVALNFLQRLSGIATLTSKFVSKVKNVEIFDTRKTTPLLRELEKQAVLIGGGKNHRFGLFDQILVKENHLKYGGGVTSVLKNLKKQYPKRKIEIEVKNIAELKEALNEKAPIIMLDNMTPIQIKKCLAEVKKSKFKPVIEISGGINLSNIKKYDIPGVSRISIGALTHSVKSLDFSLLIV